MPEDEGPFTDLVGLWVERVSIGSSHGVITFLTDEQRDEEEPSYVRRVLFNGITVSRWDRKGTSPVPVNREVAVQGRLERVTRSDDTWALVGGFGELEITASDVRRNDLHWDSEPPPVPELDIEPPHACDPMVRALTDEEDGIEYIPQFREYGYAYVVGDSSIHVIDFCPFCGAELPPGLREEWFNRLRALGLEPFDDEVPEPMQSDRWWQEADFDTDPPAPDLGSARRLPPF